MKDFVPYNLGAKTMIRNDWLKHNSFISNMLFETNNNELVFVADGTYCYCQKSSNYAFQRKSCSVQKSRHLVKPFIICTTDGHIIDIIGLFEASKNVATILTTILESDNDLKSILRENDIFVVDRCHICSPKIKKNLTHKKQINFDNLVIFSNNLVI